MTEYINKEYYKSLPVSDRYYLSPGNNVRAFMDRLNALNYRIFFPFLMFNNVYGAKPENMPSLKLILTGVISVSLLHPLQGPSPILVTPLPMLSVVRYSQAAKASSPMVVTLSGMLIVVRPLQLKNAPSQMVVTPLPMVTPVRLEEYAKANMSIVFTSLGIV